MNVVETKNRNKALYNKQYFLSVQIVMMIMLFLEIIFGSSDAYVKLDDLMLISCNVLCVLKLLSFRLYADNLIRNYSSAMNDYSTIDTKEKRMIMRRHALMGRIICYSTLFFAYLASSIFMLTPMIAIRIFKLMSAELKHRSYPCP